MKSGARIGPYEIVGPLGAGGMGEVYRARDTRLNRAIAIKILPRAFKDDPARIARFEREARLLASLNHPHIGAIYGLEEADDVTALVMELVEGEDLSARLRRGPLPIHDALTIARQIAEALDAAHEQGIVHRDLKPANIRVQRDGTVKVLDFGLAKPVATAGQETATVTAVSHAGAIMGTPAYMSPEQVRGEEAGREADIWAWGVVLHELLTGKSPFAKPTTAETLAYVLTAPPDDSLLPPDIPASVRRLVRRCLEKDPKRRWRHMGDVRIEVEEALSAAATEPVLASPSARMRQSAGWRERAAWLVASGAVVGLIVFAVLTFGRRTVEPSTVRFDFNTPPTSDAFSFALSPDGQHLVFVATVDGRPLLWVRTLDAVIAQPLSGTEGASYPFWSPDSRAVGFFADGKLKRRDLTGGPPHVLADAPGGRGGTWNSNGDIVFAPEATVGFKRVAATGGNPITVTELAPEHGSHRWPQFLPDGRRFLFFVGLGQASARGVYVGSLDGGKPRHVLTSETAAIFAPPGFLLRVLNGVLVAHRFDAERGTVDRESSPVAQPVGTDDGTFHSAFSVSNTGVLVHRPGVGTKRQLVWTDGAGTILGTLGPVDDAVPSAPELAPDGRRIALARAPEGTGDIWLIDVARNVASRVTFDPGVDSYPVWSPNGDRLFFSSGRNGRMDLFEKASDGVSEERPLIPTEQDNVDRVSQDWSPDGRVLLYTIQNPKTGSDLWAAPFDKAQGTAANAPPSQSQPFPIAQSSFDEGQGSFSPDGRWVAHVSNETGRHEVYIQPFPDLSTKWQVSTGGGIYPRWRPDGSELFYLAPDLRLMAVTLQTTSPPALLTPGVPRALFSTRLATTGPYVFTAGIFARAQYAVAADGRFLMNVVADAAASPITFVLNWTAGLRN